jgi:hypothetical protein
MPNEKKQASVINLPYQLASDEALRGCDDIEILSFQVRLFAVEKIRLIQAGKMQPTEKVIQNLKDANEVLKDFGKPTLPLDFLN